MIELSIQELSDQTGTTRRTIHFYIQQGILPPPLGAGLASRYTEGHLVRLKLIPLLRSQGSRLDQIRRIFNEQDLEGLKELLATTPQPSPMMPQKVPDSPLRPARNIQFVFPQNISISIPEALSQNNPRFVQQLIDTISNMLQNQELT